MQKALKQLSLPPAPNSSRHQQPATFLHRCDARLTTSEVKLSLQPCHLNILALPGHPCTEQKCAESRGGNEYRCGSALTNGVRRSPPPPSDYACVNTATERRLAAEWVLEMTGLSVPYLTDHEFRSALKNGVVLCELANMLWPSSIPQVLQCFG